MLFAPRGNGHFVAETARERMAVGGKQTYSLLHKNTQPLNLSQVLHQVNSLF